MPSPITPNQAAFLQMIAVSEGTAAALDPYRVCYRAKPPKASHIIVSFQDHPAITGEWTGEPLDYLGPSYAGLCSTAAGKYQIIKRTWLSCKLALGIRVQPMFSPANQDAAALWLIKQNEALTAVNLGDVAQAIELCSNTWASFTNSSAPGQPHHALAMLEDAFQSSGGRMLAA